LTGHHASRGRGLGVARPINKFCDSDWKGPHQAATAWINSQNGNPHQSRWGSTHQSVNPKIPLPFCFRRSLTPSYRFLRFAVLRRSVAEARASLIWAFGFRNCAYCWNRPMSNKERVKIQLRLPMMYGWFEYGAGWHDSISAGSPGCARRGILFSWN